MTTAPINCSHSAVWPLADFKPHPRNVNTHPEEQLRLLAKVIVGNGWRSPICVSKRSGLVIKGHGRLAAARLAGLETAPVDLQDYADEAAEMADLIADNRLSALAEIDMTALKDVLEGMTERGEVVVMAGFTEMELERVLQSFDVNGENDCEEVWSGMPQMSKDPAACRSLLVHFLTPKNVEEFAILTGAKIGEKTRFVWFNEAPKTEAQEYHES